jgi:mannose-6-phosphate isomerase
MKDLASGRIVTAQTILTPWGYEKILAKADSYAGKIIHINAGQRLSKKYHETRDKTVFVLSGVLSLSVNDIEVSHVMSDGQCVRIAPGMIHRFEAPKSGSPVVLLEISTPELEDVVRLQDDYDRK